MSAFGLYLKNTVLLSPAPVHGIVWCVSASVCTHSDMHTANLGQDLTRHHHERMQRRRTKMMALPALAGTARVQSCGSGTFPSLWAERHSSGNGMFDLCEPGAQPRFIYRSGAVQRGAPGRAGRSHLGSSRTRRRLG